MTARAWPISRLKSSGSFGASGLIFAALLFSSQLALAQTISEFPIPTVDSKPQGITTGPDGALWFTEENSGNIGRITTAGVITEFPTPAAGEPEYITTGPDGALWFTEFTGNQIGRITTAGVFTEFPVPTPGSYPSGITTGPDGALWFTESQTNKIGRITTAGVVTEFPTPTVNSNPQDITAGPDGALWFTEFQTNKIGRITTTGVINEFPIPTINSQPIGITMGPDGALWFTESNTNRIGRITTAGVISTFPVPTANSYPAFITTGPDGALWFTESQQINGNKIGRITTAGVFTEFPIPTASSNPHSITTGPDGALWFTEYDANNIGRLPPFMEVTPATGMVSAGYQRGPFNPASFQYQLTVTAGSINYSISAYPNWLTPSSSSGSVVSGTPTPVTFSVTANNLPPDMYSGTITFANTSTGQGTQIRAYALTVNPQDAVENYRRPAGAPAVRDMCDWLRRNRDALDHTGGGAAIEAPEIVQIVAALEADKACVEDLGAVNRWPARSEVPLGDYLRLWQESCAEIGAPGMLPARLAQSLRPG
jgi:virginiamycin B lyase